LTTEATTSSEPIRIGLAERWFALGVAACALAVAGFFIARLTAWPPHEDETLALFVGRESLPELFRTVQGERGGAPLHFLVAWLVVHFGGGLEALRFFSALFAVASVPAIAALCTRLSSRLAALVATALVSASWMLLFHGVYGRMYSLFLFASTLSYLAFLAALERGGRKRWGLWGAATLAAIASHPYGALVLVSQGLYVLARARTREAIGAVCVVGVLCTPFWYSDLVLAGRFDVGVGGGGDKLGGPLEVFEYLGRVAGDFTSGFGIALAAALIAAALGAWRLVVENRPAAILTACVLGVPLLALLLADLGSSTSPESRHLIFALPFFACLVALGLFEVARGRGLVLVLALAALLAAEVAWGWHKTPPLYDGEPAARVDARNEASAWLAATGRSDDVLFGYEPLYLGAWERDRDGFSKTAVPRADARLALDTLRAAPALGRGVWVFDASDTNNFTQSMEIPLRYPTQKDRFEAQVFGPFLVLRSREPTGSVKEFLEQARAAQLVGRSLYVGDADINLVTVDRARARLSRVE